MRWRIRSIAHRSIAKGASVLARIGAAGQRALVPVDPDRLTATERGSHAGGPVPEFLQALDDIGGHAILKLVDIFIMQAPWHVDRPLHIPAAIEHVGQYM